MKLIKFLFIAFSLSFPATPLYAEFSEDELVCERLFKRPGPADLSESFAKTKALIFWSEGARKKYGEGHGQWHLAQKKAIRCKKAKGSQYFYCTISAIPCKKKTPDQQITEK